jgi:beta-lactamase superfamily II metal-dependent hydrolase
LERFGEAIYRTDENGAVIVMTDVSMTTIRCMTSDLLASSL